LKATSILAIFFYRISYLSFITLSRTSCCLILFFNFLINFESSDFLLLDVSPYSKVVKPSMSCAGSMEYSGFSLAGILSFSGFESESKYGKFRMFAFFTADCFVSVVKSNFFLSMLGL
jgi:hypothetical protein